LAVLLLSLLPQSLAAAIRSALKVRRSHARLIDRGFVELCWSHTFVSSFLARSRGRQNRSASSRPRRLNSETESAATSAFETFQSFFPQQSGNRTSHATITTQQSNDRAGAASRSALTVGCALARLDRSIARCLGGGVEPTASPSFCPLTFVSLFLARLGGGVCSTASPSCCPFTFVSLILALAWATKSQRVDRSKVGVCTRGTRAARLCSTDQGKCVSDVGAGDADAKAEVDRQRQFS
jgi:hypothetical protein